MWPGQKGKETKMEARSEKSPVEMRFSSGKVVVTVNSLNLMICHEGDVTYQQHQGQTVITITGPDGGVTAKCEPKEDHRARWAPERARPNLYDKRYAPRRGKSMLDLEKFLIVALYYAHGIDYPIRVNKVTGVISRDKGNRVSAELEKEIEGLAILTGRTTGGIVSRLGNINYLNGKEGLKSGSEKMAPFVKMFKHEKAKFGRELDKAKKFNFLAR